MTDISKGGHFIRLPQPFLKSPEFFEITRFLAISEAECIGRLVLFLVFQYRRRKKSFSLKLIDKKFGANWSAALQKAGLGKIENGFFYFKPPKDLINRPPNASGGIAVSKRPRDKFGKFLPSATTKKRIIIYRADCEGNELETMGEYNAKNKHRRQPFQRSSMVFVDDQSGLSLQGIGVSGASLDHSSKPLDRA